MDPISEDNNNSIEGTGSSGFFGETEDEPGFFGEPEDESGFFDAPEEGPAEEVPPEEKKPVSKKKIAVIVLSALVAVIAAIVFIVYVSGCPKNDPDNYNFRGYAASFVTLGLFASVLILIVPKLVGLFSGGDVLEIPAEENGKRVRLTFFAIAASAFILHLLTVMFGYLVFLIQNPRTPIDYVIRWTWMKDNTDANHYLWIAQNGYVTGVIEERFLVFFPLFPMLVRGLDIITRNSFVSAQIINTIASALASGMTYLAMRSVMKERQAIASAFVILLLPGAIFMNSPMTEPLFVLLTVCAYYFMQKDRFILSGCFVALSGLTRSLGVIAAVPLFLFGISRVIGLIRSGKNWTSAAARLLFGLVISISGTLVYLWLNYSLHGDPLKFLEFQASDSWYQEACPFFDTPRYFLNYFFLYMKDGPAKWVLWFPQLFVIFGSLVLMCFAGRKLPAPYTAHYLGYFAVAIGCTWLLSSVRYLSACVPITAALCVICDKKWKRATLFAVLIPIYMQYVYAYVKGMDVY